MDATGTPKKAEQANANKSAEGRRPWSPDELRFLEENRETMSEREIAGRLGRSTSGVRHMRGRLKMGPPRRATIEGFTWTREMDATLRHNPDAAPEDLARMLGRTRVAVMHRRRHLGLAKRRPEISWKADEDAVLRSNPNMPPKSLAERLRGRTETAIRARRKALGLPPYVSRREWSEDYIRTLKDNLQAPMGELVKMLPRQTKSSIRGMARKLGRKRTIRKGHSVSNGYISRYRGGKSMLDHRLVMERELGRKVKPEEVVHHINCDRTDNRPENLDLLPDASAHNSTHRSFHRLLPDLLDAGIVGYDEGSHTYGVVQHG